MMRLADECVGQLLDRRGQSQTRLAVCRVAESCHALSESMAPLSTRISALLKLSRDR
jgi:hypothetical protein